MSDKSRGHRWTCQPHNRNQDHHHQDHHHHRRHRVLKRSAYPEGDWNILGHLCTGGQKEQLRNQLTRVGGDRRQRSNRRVGSPPTRKGLSLLSSPPPLSRAHSAISSTLPRPTMVLTPDVQPLRLRSGSLSPLLLASHGPALTSSPTSSAQHLPHPAPRRSSTGNYSQLSDFHLEDHTEDDESGNGVSGIRHVDLSVSHL